MMIFKKAIPRRTFLRGAGAAIALPVLDSMVPAFASALDVEQQPATRMIYFYGANGRIMKKWIPTEVGADYKLSPTLEPLAAFRNDFLVLSGLNMRSADPVGNEPGGNHARPCASYLTGVHPKPNQTLGVSVDQLAAKQLSKFTQLGSLEMTMESGDVLGKADGAYSDAYTKTISWRSATQPLPMEFNPRKIFERLLGSSDSTDKAERLRQARDSRSILDSVSEGVAGLFNEVTASDRVRLNEYLDAIRDIERRIQLAEEQASRTLPEMAKPAGVPALYSEHAKLLFDLKLIAFQGDLTRVSTFMWGIELGEGDYREIGIKDGHHASSHHSGIPDLISNCVQVDHFHSTMFAYFLDKMKTTRDGDGTMLDHSVIVYGSGLSDGMAHTHNDIPVLLAGGGNGKLKGGRHIRYEGLPFSNIHQNVMEMVGIPMEESYIDPKFSDTTGKLDLS
ncbi:MAG: DUF1552 domain-containing protein [Acidobacteria bacterium]|nr:DUF1552 domain-containing protein [Acidobacteriota bacterium]